MYSIDNDIAGEGLDTAIHYDSSWHPAVEDQAIGRIYSRGQEQGVLYTI